VCVPRVEPRTEQLIRARTLARLGLLRLLEPELLEPYRLRAEVAALLGTDRRNLASRAHAALSFDGAERAATELLELASAKPGDAGADSIRREMAEARDRYLRAL
jgi:predicted glycosyltransferase